jgi:glycogen phosphorylase
MSISSLTVLPAVPKELETLREMAYNLWYSWNQDCIRLFRFLDKDLFEKCRQSPVKMLNQIPIERLQEVAHDNTFLLQLGKVHAHYQNYLQRNTWFEEEYGKKTKNTKLVYFCLEFGIHESLPIYSGGLGMLAGDHLKSASDLGLPMTGIGLYYKTGYFRQQLGSDGRQLEFYPVNHWYDLPMELACDAKGNGIKLKMQIGKEDVNFQIWKVNVGRNPLYLLDTDVEGNTPDLRKITQKLYDGDREIRIQQEILLGVGGVRALEALNIDPGVFHINEGHAAFLLFERITQEMKKKALSRGEARDLVWSTSVFTTHTPVPAGNERFGLDLMKKYYSSIVGDTGYSYDEFLALGRENPSDVNEEFCMTIVALKLAAFANGVSLLHGEVSRSMWTNIFPGVPHNEIPIHGLTNGVHAMSWMGKKIKNLFRAYEHTQELNIMHLNDASEISHNHLWHAHLEQKEKLVLECRKNKRRFIARHGLYTNQSFSFSEILDPSILTIGFARRFATYKRGDLIFRDINRLKRILLDEKRPMQIIFAGKAHPSDENGKDIIKNIHNIIEHEGLSHRIVFVEDYDIDLGRLLTQGVDVWLNNPIRPMEASGTSGMKAAMNGVLNLSILDGWWAEGFGDDVGFAIGWNENLGEGDGRDLLDADLLYQALEQKVIPTFYKRDEQDLPIAWINMMKSSIVKLGTEYSTNRMVKDYMEMFYKKASVNSQKMISDDCSLLKEFHEWNHLLKSNWKEIEFKGIEHPDSELLRRSEEVQIGVRVKLGNILPEHVKVEVFYGRLTDEGKFTSGEGKMMDLSSSDGNVAYFKKKISFSYGGRCGYQFRVLPRHEYLASQFIPGFISWS